MSKSIVDVIRELAADCPDCVYTHYEVSQPGVGSRKRCMYSKGQCSNGSCGCIVGQALKILGCDVELLDKDGTCQNARHVLDVLGIGTVPERTWAYCVQGRQDHGETWGAAVAYADKHYPFTVAA